MQNHRALLADAIGLSVITGLLLTVFGPAILRDRSQARSNLCSSHLRTIGLAAHQYHAAYNQFPAALSGTEGGEEWQSNQGRLGPLVAMLPFMEQQDLWEQISHPLDGNTSKKRFSSMGPAPWYDPSDYLPWSSAPLGIACPESGLMNPTSSTTKKIVDSWEQMSTKAAASGLLATSYVASFGDGTQLQGRKVDPTSPSDRARAFAGQRGIFTSGALGRMRDILDGTSNTLLYSEVIGPDQNKNPLARIANHVTGLSLNPSLCLKLEPSSHSDWFEANRGSRWADGTLALTGFQTVLPPNSPSCLSENGLDEPVVSASSQHKGGVHVLFADGSVTFATNEIDCGSASIAGVGIGDGFTQPGSKSPYGIWGALGSRASREIAALTPANPDTSSTTDSPLAKEPDSDTWTDKSGKKKLTAKFLRIVDRKTIELEGTDGTQYRLPLNSLSNSDILRAVKMSMKGP